MKIWLLNPYGPLPGEAWRETRYAMLGRELARHGHEVIWWTAGFCHHSKTVRTTVPKSVPVEAGFTIQLVPTPPYRRHVGVARLRFELTFAWRVLRMASNTGEVQAIVSSDATMPLAFVGRSLARQKHASLIYDIIDLSPEVFFGSLPTRLRGFAPALFAPLFAMRNWNFRHASGVIAVCDDYLLPARNANPQLEQERLLSVYWGTDMKEFDAAKAPAEELPNVARQFGKRDGEMYAIYAGTLGVLYDIDALLDAARRLNSERPELKLLVAGGGPRAEDIRRYISDHGLNSLRMLGEMSFANLIRLYQICDIGLCIYGPSSPVAMPIKIYDYLAAGLPVVNSIGGFLERMIRSREIGMQYKAGDGASLASALVEMISEQSSLKHMAANARQASAEFDSKTQYGNLSRFLEELGSGGTYSRSIAGTSTDVESASQFRG